MTKIISTYILAVSIMALIGMGEQSAMDAYHSIPYIPHIQSHQHTGTYVVLRDTGDPGTREPTWPNFQTSASLAASGFESQNVTDESARYRPDFRFIAMKNPKSKSYTSNWSGHSYSVTQANCALTTNYWTSGYAALPPSRSHSRRQ